MTKTESFEHTFIAVSYLLGRRTELTDGLANAGDASRHAARLLAASNQAERARRLATLLHPLALDLEARRLK